MGQHTAGPGVQGRAEALGRLRGGDDQHGQRRVAQGEVAQHRGQRAGPESVVHEQQRGPVAEDGRHHLLGGFGDEGHFDLGIALVQSGPQLLDDHLVGDRDHRAVHWLAFSRGALPPSLRASKVFSSSLRSWATPGGRPINRTSLAMVFA